MLWIKRMINSLITVITTLITLMRIRRVAAMGLIGCLFMAFMPVGCGSRLGPITASQSRLDGKAPVPAVTVQRLTACMEVYGEQLGPGSHRINPVIKADKNGVKWSVTENDIPNSAAEFGSCTRQALRDMEIPAEFFRLAEVMQQGAKGDVSKAQRSNMGSPLILVVGVAIGLSELMFEAGAYTILFAISVELVQETAKDIAETLRLREQAKEDCDREMASCFLSATASKRGSVKGAHRCEWCWEACMRNEGNWPSQADTSIGKVRCDYWVHK
jgi:hypothetical protein